MSKPNTMSRYYSEFVILAVLLPTLSVTSMSLAKERKDEAPGQDSGSMNVYAPYCGVNCVYTIAKLAGRQLTFEDLLKPEYIGSAQGSSLAELKKAAEDQGLYAAPIGGLTPGDLSKLTYPTILHMKSTVGSPRYDHYEIVLEFVGDQLRLLDPPNASKVVSMSEIAPRWGGTGLVVSGTPIDLGNAFAPAQRRFALWAMVVITGVICLRSIRRYLPNDLLRLERYKLGLSIAQGVGLGAGALVCAFGYHFILDGGMLARAGATEGIQHAHAGDFIPKIGVSAVEKMVEGDTTVFVDARYKRDFETGHLEGAINVPVYASDGERREAMADVSKDTKIVIYCQSAGCSFAKIVAVKLKDDGFSDVSIFKGGWNKWASKNHRQKESDS